MYGTINLDLQQKGSFAGTKGGAKRKCGKWRCDQYRSKQAWALCNCRHQDTSQQKSGVFGSHCKELPCHIPGYLSVHCKSAIRVVVKVSTSYLSYLSLHHLSNGSFKLNDAQKLIKKKTSQLHAACS